MIPGTAGGLTAANFDRRMAPEDRRSQEPPRRPWRVEVLSWPRLPPERQRQFLQMAGEAGGEWWGNGRILLQAYPQAYRLSATARALGFYVRLEEETTPRPLR